MRSVFKWVVWGCVCAAVLALCACAARQTPTPTAAPDQTPTPAAPQTPAPTWTATPAPTATALPTQTPLPAATPSPTPSPTPGLLGGGGLIVYSARIEGNWDLYALPVGREGAPRVEPLRLTSHPAEDRSPAISPDGRRLAFSSRRNGYWNLYLLTPDGVLSQLTDDPAYDGAPAWSPDGRWLAFESVRGGDLDLWLLDLESGEATNLTKESPSGGCGPVWSPDGAQIGFTSWRFGDKDVFSVDLESGKVHQLTSAPSEEHLYGWGAEGELLYVLSAGEDQDAYGRPVGVAADQPGKRLTRWRVVDAPARSPDGRVLAFLRRARYGARLMLEHPGDPGDVPLWLTDEIEIVGPLAWTALPAGWAEAQGEPVVLYEERTAPGEDAPYTLKWLEGVTAPNARLSDRVDDSFVAMRARVLAESGHDFLSELSDAWRGMSWYSPGSAYASWHKAGRAIDVLLDYFSRDYRQRWLEVVLEPGGGEVLWRLYLRAAEQDGSQGRPLTVRPWDLTADARSNGRGGRYKPMPEGYYVDLTDLMAQYGWLRISSYDHPAFHWYESLTAVEYWHLQKTEGLLWYDAMLEIYSAELMEQHHRWEVQQERGMQPWLARAKGVPLPESELRLLEHLDP